MATRVPAAERPLSSSEFLVVDVETNGRAGPECEMTEVGAVLVGGGELHDRFSSLLRVLQPLPRGIQRFTGITQAMVDSAPSPAQVLPELARRLDGRVMVAHSASFDARVLRQAFEREGLQWPEPEVLCTVAMARRFAPLVRQRGLGPLAGALGIDVEATHRALVDAETCARVFCALFPRLCAAAPTVAEGAALLRPRRRQRTRSASRPVPPAERPELGALPNDPGVYIFRDERGRPLYVGKSVSVRTRARAHFCRPAGWTERAALVDYRPTRSELGALVLESRLIKAWQPAGNVRLKRTDGYLYVRARLDIDYPILDLAAEPAAGRAVNIGPVRGRAAASELVDQLNSLFALRHCGRALRRRPHPSAYGQMGRCLSPCLGDLDPNLYRRRLDEALSLFDEAGGGERLLEHVEAQMREAAANLNYERAAVLRRRRERLATVLERIDGVLRATLAGSRLVAAAHPSDTTCDAFWLVAGRVADWGPLPDDAGELVERTDRALTKASSHRRAPIPADEVDEIRIVSAWLASHPETPQLKLSEEMGRAALTEFATALHGTEPQGVAGERADAAPEAIGTASPKGEPRARGRKGQRRRATPQPTL